MATASIGNKTCQSSPMISTLIAISMRAAAASAGQIQYTRSRHRALSKIPASEAVRSNRVRRSSAKVA